jgi:hypothetical protein
MNSPRFLLLATSALTVAILAQDKPLQHPYSESDEGLGRVHMDISRAPAVAAEFDRALALLHNFWYVRALERFNQATKMPVLEGNQPAIRTIAMRWRPPTPNTPTTKPPCFMDCRSSVRSRKVPTVLSSRRKLQGSSRLCMRAIRTILARFTI